LRQKRFNCGKKDLIPAAKG